MFDPALSVADQPHKFGLAEFATGHFLIGPLISKDAADGVDKGVSDPDDRSLVLWASFA